MSFRRSFKQYGRKSGRFLGDAESRGSTPEKYGRGDGPLPYQAPVKNINFDPKEFQVAECSLKDIEVYKQIFDFFDTDDDGMLTPMDIRRAMMQYGGYHCKRNFVYQIIAIFDLDFSGEINFKEFVKMMTKKPCENDKDEEIGRVFDQIDFDQKGYISENDLLTLAEEVNKDISVEDIRVVMRKCDPKSQGGKITREAFIAFNKRKEF